jgi:hypothetical protein
LRDEHDPDDPLGFGTSALVQVLENVRSEIAWSTVGDERVFVAG